MSSLAGSRIALRMPWKSSRRRCLHGSVVRLAISNLQMPAMSPTMTEGGIAEWKKKEGEAFSPGDVLLEIETDKATIDVEAQDEGIMGKILSPNGAKNVPVGKIIALLAEEGDDISNLEVPKEEPVPGKVEVASSPPSPPPSQSPPEPAQPQPSPVIPHPGKHPRHSRPLFPSVHRLLLEYSISKPEDIKGTGIRGMLTKGDVLAFLGQASSPTGTYKESEKMETNLDSKKPEPKPNPLDGPSLRKLIVSNLMQSSVRARPAAPTPSFDSIIADYLPSSPSFITPTPFQHPPSSKSKRGIDSYFDGLF